MGALGNLKPNGSVKMVMDELQHVSSFDLSWNRGGIDKPPTVILVLGVEEEIDQPVAMAFNIDQVEYLIAHLQRHATAARQAGLN